MSAPLRTSSISSRWSSAACAPTLGWAPAPEPAGELATDVELDVGVAHEQGLGVGVDRDELDALEAHLDHAVDGVDATASDADHLDDGEVVLRCCHGVEEPLGRSCGVRAGPVSRRRTLDLNETLRVMSTC
jgi:hypothetical protein